MNRPIYETTANLTKEGQVAQKICSWAGVTMKKLSPKYPFDRAIIHAGEITGFLEIKVRTNRSDLYPDYLISAAKLFHAMNWKRQTGISCFLAVQWLDLLGYHEIDPDKNYDCRLAGRVDRGDEQDLEPCFFVPVGWFKRVE